MSSASASAPPTGGETGNSYAINSVHFNRDMFVSKIIQECSLDNLMQTEKKLNQEIVDLSSEMQTLVYENYNKFILATDTIRKMKTDFKEMEEKMTLLSENIAKITDSSSKIASNLQGSRQKVCKYSSIHDLLKKLKFLFELPNTLKQYSEEANYEEAVRCYLNGVRYIQEFRSFPSLEAIKVDCRRIVSDLRTVLYTDFEDTEKSSQDLIRNVTLLLSLKEEPPILARRFLENTMPKLSGNLDSLRIASNPNVPLDEFMELSCGLFLSNLSLVIASFSQAFIQATELTPELRLESQETLKEFTERLLHDFVIIVEGRLIAEVKELSQHGSESRENLLKTIERLYRRLLAMGTLIPNTNFALIGITLISKIAQLDAELSLQRIRQCYEKSVKEAGFELRSHPSSSQEILGSIMVTLVGQLKLGLDKLGDYLNSDYQFSQNADFRQKVAIVIIRESHVIGCFKYLITYGKKLLDDNNYDSVTWLLVAKLYLDMEMGTVACMVNLVETEYGIKKERSLPWNITSVSEITAALHGTAQKLLEEFVSSQGNQIAELMKEAVSKSMAFTSVEPIGPQPQMRKAVEILTKLEKYVEFIFPDMDTSHIVRSERSSDSSRRSYSTIPGGGISSKNLVPHRPSWSNTYDPNLSSNIQKLFSEKVEIFGDIQFQKNEIIMTIVKISLRALLEVVRMRTLSREGLHQIQIDIHYLQLYLWKFVNNEGFLHSLLDEILASCIHRCVDPVQLESTLVEILAERNANF